MNETICTIIPAAGSSSRLGRPKQLVDFEGESLIRRATKTALETTTNVIVVTGCEDAAVRKEIEDLAVFVVDNPEWENGMGKSIAVGLQAAMDRFTSLSHVLVHLCDLPLIGTDHLEAILNEGERSDLVLTKYEDTIGVPALFGKDYFPSLLFLDGDQGAKQFLGQEARDRALTVEFRGVFVDIDQPEDLEPGD